MSCGGSKTSNPVAAMISEATKAVNEKFKGSGRQVTVAKAREIFHAKVKDHKGSLTTIYPDLGGREIQRRAIEKARDGLERDLENYARSQAPIQTETGLVSALNGYVLDEHYGERVSEHPIRVEGEPDHKLGTLDHETTPDGTVVRELPVLYHGSAREFAIGEVIAPQSKKFAHAAPVEHEAVPWINNKHEYGYVYEVEPADFDNTVWHRQIKYWNNTSHEYLYEGGFRVIGARMIKVPR